MVDAGPKFLSILRNEDDGLFHEVDTGQVLSISWYRRLRR